MRAVQFSCPHCSAKLRVRERMLLDQQLNCPECGKHFSLSVDKQNGLGGGQLVASKAAPAATAKPPKSDETEKKESTRKTRSAQPVPDQSTETTTEDQLQPKARWLEIWESPVGIAWTVAAVFGIAIIVAADPIGGTPETGANVKPPVKPTGAIPEDTHTNSKSPRDPDKPDKPKKSELVVDGSDDPTILKLRLSQLGRQLLDYEKNNNAFPSGTVGKNALAVEDRFSWLAELAVYFERNGVADPLWDRSWQDPLNDGYVRRRLTELHNPAIQNLVAENLYPATHFVGMAGLGADAAELPKHHPRAGMFGHSRRTTVDDIKDGTSNTIMVAGVNNRLGAWAAGGSGSVRPFTQQPYINGPDGFGTGNKNGMHVLMADGRVRFMNNNTSPLILQRMACIADGLPLDPTVAGVPSDPKPKNQTEDPLKPKLIAGDPKVANKKPDVPDNGKPLANIKPAKDTTEQPKIEKPVAKPIDVKAALEQRILKFEQKQSVAFEEILLQVEEMAGVPIRFNADEIGREILEKRISLTLSQTTVGEILTRSLALAGLKHEIESDGIRLRLRD